MDREPAQFLSQAAPVAALQGPALEAKASQVTVLQAAVLQPAVPIAAPQAFRLARQEVRVVVVVPWAEVSRLPQVELSLAVVTVAAATEEESLPLPEVHSTAGRQTDLLSFCAKKVP